MVQGWERDGTMGVKERKRETDRQCVNGRWRKDWKESERLTSQIGFSSCGSWGNRMNISGFIFQCFWGNNDESSLLGWAPDWVSLATSKLPHAVEGKKNREWEELDVAILEEKWWERKLRVKGMANKMKLWQDCVLDVW